MTTVGATSDTPVDNLGVPTTERPIYLDCAATTPLEPAVVDEVMHYMAIEYGNAGSRTHGYGQVAKERIQLARRQVASVVDAQPDEVIFTSGATESNNLALLGLGPVGVAEGRRHIVSSQIEHKAVLEPLQHLERMGFEVTLVPPMRSGAVDADAVIAAVREDTLAVSIMAANNETGVIQPISRIGDALGDHSAYFHTDAAQASGKIGNTLSHKRLDLISISGHKMYAPKGIGALVSRRRGFKRLPLSPLMYGGGQERGLRPGTLPVALIAGFGLASELAANHSAERSRANTEEHLRARMAFSAIGAHFNGDPALTLPSTLNVSVPGVDSEAALLALKDLIAFSNGSACTSAAYEASHVLVAAGLPAGDIEGAMRFSWSHMTPSIPWEAICSRLGTLASVAH